MPINTVDQIVPLYPETLRDFVKHKVLTYVDRDEHYKIQVDNQAVNNLVELHKGDIRRLMGLKFWVKMLDNPSDSASVYTHACVFRDGLRVFRPTAYQCEMLSRVELNIAATDYVQPYDTIVIEWPADFRRRLRQLYPDLILPLGTIIHWIPDRIMMVVTVEDPDELRRYAQKAENHDKAPVSGSIFMMDMKCDTTIEHWLNVRHPIDSRSEAEMNEMDWDSGVFIGRTALNLAMFLTENKFKTQSANPELIKQAESGPNRKLRREAAARLQDTATLMVLEDQNIKLHDTEAGVRDVSVHETDFVTMRPHFRKGHRRTLIPGEGKPWKERKTVFIRAVMINKHKISEDNGPNTIIYKS